MTLIVLFCNVFKNIKTFLENPTHGGKGSRSTLFCGDDASLLSVFTLDEELHVEKKNVLRQQQKNIQSCRTGEQEPSHCSPEE